jgi:phage shock protein C
METTVKQLKRSNRNRVFGGVCGGLAEYFVVDVVVVRVAYVALTILSAGIGGILLYVFAWMLIPLDTSGEATLRPTDVHHSRGVRILAGAFLMIAGILALGGTLLPWSFHLPRMRFIAPLLLVAFGAALLFRTHDRAPSSTTPPQEGGTELQTSGSEHAEIRRLMRSHKGRKIAGVCAGVGDYLNIDPTLVRMVWILLTLIYGMGILLYLILWIAMPLREDRSTS